MNEAMIYAAWLALFDMGEMVTSPLLFLPAGTDRRRYMESRAQGNGHATALFDAIGEETQRG